MSVDNKSWVFSKKNVIIGILIFILLLGAGGFFGYQKYISDYSLIENQIQDSKIRVDSIRKRNIELEKKITIFEKNIEQIDNNISKIDKDITKLKRDTDEKIRNVDNYTPSELQYFFSNRYRFNTDSIR